MSNSVLKMGGYGTQGINTVLNMAGCALTRRAWLAGHSKGHPATGDLEILQDVLETSSKIPD